jgi:CheY-like chemotaxis protein
MRAKRALIVDDSKSARLFLSRILVQHAIEVETVESAEAAIEFLADHRPDVIFMDHQMPGMDGLQAVKAIKNNPVTATIPIMMYTSQEGELYLGQARALGAIGVMPKQIRQADVSKVLYELHLLPDRRNREHSGLHPVSLDALADAAVAAERTGEHPVAAGALSEAALQDHLGELRRAIVSSIESQSDRIVASMQAALHGDAPPLEIPAATSQAQQSRWPYLLAAASLLVAFVSTAMWWRESRLLQQAALVSASTSTAAQTRAAEPSRPTVSTATSGTTQDPSRAVDALSGDKPVVISVPYGEPPLGAARIASMRQLFTRLAAQKFRGVVDVRSFPGRFCLMGNAEDGYSLAPDESPYSRCDTVGNPEAAEASRGEPLQFANLVGALRNSTRGTADVRVHTGDALTMLVPYPEVTPGLTAGEWNRAAGMNNRVEIRLR